jgi:hypothetical protein
MVKQWAAHAAPIAVQFHANEAAAKASAQTPEGRSYQSSSARTYRGLVQECVRTDGGSVDKWEGIFETLISVGAKGTVEDSEVCSMGPVATCLYQKLHVLQQEKATPFLPPPHAPYWVRVDLDWAEFAPVAAK